MTEDYQITERVKRELKEDARFKRKRLIFVIPQVVLVGLAMLSLYSGGLGWLLCVPIVFIFIWLENRKEDLEREYKNLLYERRNQ